MRILNKLFPLLIVLNGLSFCAFSQNPVITEAGITASIVEPLSILSNIVKNDTNNMAIILIIMPVKSGASTSATYYLTRTTNYTYTDTSPVSPPIANGRSNSLKIASFINNPVIAPGSDLLTMYVSVTPSNVTVSYN